MNNRIMLFILTSFNLTQIYCCDICCKPNLDESTRSSNSRSKPNLKPIHSTRGNLDSDLPLLDLKDNCIDNLLKKYKKEENEINALKKNDQKLFEQRMLELDKKCIMNKKNHEENMLNIDIDHDVKMDKIGSAHIKAMEEIKKERIIEVFRLNIRSLKDKKEVLEGFFGALKKKIDRYSEFKTLEEYLIEYEKVFKKTYESAKLASEYEIKEAIDFISNYDNTPNYNAVYLGAETFKNITDVLSNYKNNLKIYEKDIDSFKIGNEGLKSKKAEYLECQSKLSNENKGDDDKLNNLKKECYELFLSVCTLAKKIQAYNDDAYNFKNNYILYESDEDNFKIYIIDKNN